MVNVTMIPCEFKSDIYHKMVQDGTHQIANLHRKQGFSTVNIY